MWSGCGRDEGIAGRLAAPTRTRISLSASHGTSKVFVGAYYEHLTYIIELVQISEPFEIAQLYIGRTSISIPAYSFSRSSMSQVVDKRQ